MNNTTTSNYNVPEKGISTCTTYFPFIAHYRFPTKERKTKIRFDLCFPRKKDDKPQKWMMRISIIHRIETRRNQTVQLLVYWLFELFEATHNVHTKNSRKKTKIFFFFFFFSNSVVDTMVLRFVGTVFGAASCLCLFFFYFGCCFVLAQLKRCKKFLVHYWISRCSYY